MEEKFNSKQTIICQDCEDVIDVTDSPEGGRVLYGVCLECRDESVATE
ncbi:GapA-binding peptide SR1P [Terribacillus sp. 179-K 1B1 HS]